MTLRRTAHNLLALLRKRRLERELEGEIEAHLELAERDALARGLSPEDARREARLRFGGVEQVKELHRERRSFVWLEALLRDLRYGLSSLARSPGFTASVVGVLALGIGANVAMFSIVDAVMLKPLPFAEPDRIVRVWEAPRPGVSNATSAANFLEWKRLATDFEALSAEQSISVALQNGGEPARLNGKAVTSEYFRVFGTQARLGRTFSAEEDQGTAARVIVLSHATWQNDFGADPDILTRRPMLDGEPYQVIGVLAPGAFDRDETKFWKPLAFTPVERESKSHWLMVYGRLREGAELTQVNGRMQAVYAATMEKASEEDRQGAIVVERLARLLVGDNLQRSISIAFGAVALVLLIACANVANLLLAKGAARSKELAVRSALGASRGRLVAQLLTETLVLCLLGGAAGVVLAWTLIRVATPALKEALPFTAEVTLDPRVLGFAGLVALAVALLTGTFPALQTSFGSLAQTLNRAARGSSGSHALVRRAIVIGEVGLSLVLVCGALLLLKSLLKLQQIETGIRVEHVITTSVDLPKSSYPTPEKAAQFYEAVAERLRSVPGVSRVGMTSHMPLQWIGNGEALQEPGERNLVRVRLKRVDPGYFQTLGIPLLAGRGITARDTASAPRVVVINEALAARLKDVSRVQEAVGRKVRVSMPPFGEPTMSMPEVEIAGVIRGERVGPPGMPDPAVVYVPLAQTPATHVKLIVLAQTDVAAAVTALREAVRGVDAKLPLGEVVTLEQVRERTLSGASRPAWLIGVFAVIAALLAGIGLYGVISHTVSQRRREIGIRMALGARSRDVLSQVLRNAVSLVCIGLGIGLLGALALTRVMKSLLYEVSPLDPLAFAASCLAMVLVGLLAGWLPAHRAAGVDPVTTLRDEG
ncbi:ABC transporter permease [Paludibaculum fermentans]|uniref:ABC transporter permease n=1 Tax=Paludibaculum fermentans TaxID=1473598 RepID=A0A7S7NVN3_PALFE|nr:ABC transporter permease [Paludibaculum fermentans]QOY90663.1 ABC transporter permease [Paludibaculum fermentans]